MCPRVLLTFTTRSRESCQGSVFDVSALDCVPLVPGSGPRWLQVSSRRAWQPKGSIHSLPLSVHLMRTPCALWKALITSERLSRAFSCHQWLQTPNSEVTTLQYLLLWFFFHLVISTADFRVALCAATARCRPHLWSDSCGWLDFGGEDLPEPPLQLLHVRGFGSGQVEASSPFLPVSSTQCSDHLVERGRNFFCVFSFKKTQFFCLKVSQLGWCVLWQCCISTIFHTCLVYTNFQQII